ncbi:MAG TPA: hypothetical protein VH113_10700 [Gemmatimonadales bacterium]|nr:hypothetical protein [Gemmatimonadales bacterium]
MRNDTTEDRRHWLVDRRRRKTRRANAKPRSGERRKESRDVIIDRRKGRASERRAGAERRASSSERRSGAERRDRP